MQNRGYQLSDEGIVDYDLWHFAGELLRGPAISLDRPYFSALGAAQTFGRFVDNNFTKILSNKLGLDALNLGISGAGPSFFLAKPEFIDVVNRGRFAIVQILSARSTSNRLVALGKNQGESVLRSDSERVPLFSEIVYQRLLKALPPEELTEIRTQCRINYVNEMKELIRRISVPVILLYFSKRKLDYEENVLDLGGYWGDYPHFVNRKVVEALIPETSAYVHAESSTGLPQQICDKSSGKPIEIWPSDKFPSVKFRTCNNYYPSPEMHLEAANSIALSLGLIQRERASWRVKRRTPATSKLLLHSRVERPGSIMFENSLRDSFAKNWSDLDRSLGSPSLTDFISRQQLPYSLSISKSFSLSSVLALEGVAVSPVVFLEHPILRVWKLFESHFKVEEELDLHGERLSKGSDFESWVGALLGSHGAHIISNNQTRACIYTRSEYQRNASKQLSLDDLNTALKNLSRCHVGATERYLQSLVRVEAELRKQFPSLTLLDFSPSIEVKDIRAECRRIADGMSIKGYGALCAANDLDLHIYDHYCLS